MFRSIAVVMEGYDLVTVKRCTAPWSGEPVSLILYCDLLRSVRTMASHTFAYFWADDVKRVQNHHSTSAERSQQWCSLW